MLRPGLSTCYFKKKTHAEWGTETSGCKSSDLLARGISCSGNVIGLTES